MREENIYNEEMSGMSLVVGNELIQTIDEKDRENQGFTISKLSEQFLQISQTI